MSSVGFDVCRFIHIWLRVARKEPNVCNTILVKQVSLISKQAEAVSNWGSALVACSSDVTIFYPQQMLCRDSIARKRLRPHELLVALQTFEPRSTKRRRRSCSGVTPCATPQATFRSPDAPTSGKMRRGAPPGPERPRDPEEAELGGEFVDSEKVGIP